MPSTPGLPTMPNNTEDNVNSINALPLESKLQFTAEITVGEVLDTIIKMHDADILSLFSLVDEALEDIDFTLKACNVFLNELIKFHNDELEYYTEKNLHNAFLNNEKSVGPLYKEDMKVAQKAINLILKFQKEYKQLTD